MKYEWEEDFKKALDDMLPPWATGRTHGEFVLNAVLFTRDGRLIGNARIVGIEEREGLGQVFRCLTDAGNLMTLTLREVKELFYPPAFIGTESPLELVQHELAILENDYKLYPGAWCCTAAKHSNGWHHEMTCKNWVMVP